MKKLIKELKEVEVVKEVNCNKCAESLKVSESGSDEFYGLVGAKVHGGYFSTDLEDGTEYEFDLCEKCVKEMFDSFKMEVSKKVLF